MAEGTRRRAAEQLELLVISYLYFYSELKKHETVEIQSQMHIIITKTILKTVTRTIYSVTEVGIHMTQSFL